MKNILCVIVMAACAYGKPLASTDSAWQANPIFWGFRADSVLADHTEGSHMADYLHAPVASNVTFSATFVPARCGTNGWRVGGIALVQDQQNFWKLSLALTPPEQGGTPFMEFCEMRNGEWLAQGNLQVAQRESKGTWSFSKAYRLAIVLESDSIRGTIESEDQTVRFVQQYRLGQQPAVRAGRPTLAYAGIAGTYSKLDACWSNAMPEGAIQKQFPRYSVPPNTEITDQATGFFRVVQKPDGRWWTIDPNGFGVVLLGVDHVTFWGHYCQKLGYAPHFKKNQAKYPDRSVWENETLGRLTAWGFNMLGAGCGPELKHRGLVHTEFLSLGDTFGSLGGDYEIAPQEHRPCSVFPNVFHPDFERYCTYLARMKCAENRHDPWLLGYFIDNELAWWGRGALDTGLFDYALAKPATHAIKPVMVDFLKTQAKNDVTTFNRCWRTQIATFDALKNVMKLPSESEEQKQIKLAFLKLVANRYFEVTTRAIRAADPNHLVLGSRFAGTLGAHPAVWETAGKYCDIVTFNIYPMADLDDGQVYLSLGKKRERVIDHVQKFYDTVKRPMLITEWSFPALDSGLPCLHGAGQRFQTQAERTEATSLFARTMLSMPYLLGYDYFMWVDEPALGISDAFPEDSNYGLINEEGNPYALITEMFSALHKKVGTMRFAAAPAAKAVPAREPIEVSRQVARLTPSAATPAGFSELNSTLVVTNGVLSLTIKKGEGGLIADVALAGVRMGDYTAMVHVPNAWVNVDRVVDYMVSQKGPAVVVDIRGETRYQVRCEVIQRITLLPAAAYFIAEFIQVKNLGEKPLDLRGLFFRPIASYAVAAKERGVPSLWKRPVMGCWPDEKGSRCYGAFVPQISDVLINFWINPEGGGQHADARMEFSGQVLAPQAVFAPQFCYVFCLLSQTGAAEWENQACAILK